MVRCCSGVESLCYKCYDLGHQLKEFIQTVTCSKWGSIDHLVEGCDQVDKQDNVKGKTFNNGGNECLKENFAGDCPKDIKEVLKGGNRGCYNFKRLSLFLKTV